MLGMTIAMILTRNMDLENVRYCACFDFSNAGYMGFPSYRISVWCRRIVFYASSYNTVFNIMPWTFGYAMVSGQIRPNEILHTVITTPAIIANPSPLGLIIYMTHFPRTGYNGEAHIPL